jgi:hypothetical protein
MPANFSGSRSPRPEDLPPPLLSVVNSEPPPPGKNWGTQRERWQRAILGLRLMSNVCASCIIPLFLWKRRTFVTRGLKIDDQYGGAGTLPREFLMGDGICWCLRPFHSDAITIDAATGDVSRRLWVDLQISCQLLQMKYLYVICGELLQMRSVFLSVELVDMWSVETFEGWCFDGGHQMFL